MIRSADREPRRPGNRLTLVRLVLAAMVLVSHASEYVDGDRSREPLTRLFHTLSFGDVAVDGFFTLSGFLLMRSWRRDPDAVAFLARRARRLYPGFIVASLFAVTVVAPLGATDPMAYWRGLSGDPANLLVRLLLLLPPATPPIFPGLPYPWIEGAMWTIHYEALCYLALAAMGVAGLLRSQVLWAVWLGCLASYTLMGLTRTFAGDPALPIGGSVVLLRFAMFFLGGATWARSSGRPSLSPGLACAATVALMVCLPVPALAEPALATVGAWLLLAIGTAPARPIPLPDISYGIYLYGTPMELLLIFHHPAASPLLILAAALPCAGLLGWLSWRWVERPVLERREKRILADC